ncbi:histidinol-phosphate transaminase [Streptomyces sp. BE147]|uniref:histidinol-phosphate transaminase n=1 Tax=Streptomyces sp. BE147 TaxID=3002524 RepID=UPI002E78A9A4|nr:histidinol-phosphate transaminase [Streptomyces sp. BE147]MEE1739730.1 histidinol-phosphate transaminase [Streptomyces sp. BE147]
MSHPPLRAVLETVASYKPSEGVHGPTARTRPLSANESPHTPLPGIVEAIEEAGSTVNRYPDPGCGALTGALARSHGIAEDRIVVGAGSVALLQTLFQSIADPGAEAVYAWPSFEVYPTLAALAGVESVQVPLDGEAHDLRAMTARISSRTRLVIICNPNNPTGTAIGHEELREFVEAVPPTCLVAVDEAYHEYVRDPEVTSALGLCAAHPNLVVLRTFSKAYGLAGLRTGYLVGDARVVERLRKACLPYAVNTVAQRAAVAALGLEEQLLRRVDSTVAERTRVRDTLVRGGWEIPDSQANFLWLRLGRNAAGFGAWCAGRDIAVRAFPDVGVRVSIGSAEDNDRFLAAAEEWRSARRTAAAGAGRTRQARKKAEA